MRTHLVVFRGRTVRRRLPPAAPSDAAPPPLRGSCRSLDPDPPLGPADSGSPGPLRSCCPWLASAVLAEGSCRSQAHNTHEIVRDQLAPEHVTVIARLCGYSRRRSKSALWCTPHLHNRLR